MDTLTPRGVQQFEAPKPKGDLSGLKRVEISSTRLEFGGNSLDIVNTYTNGTERVVDSFSAVSGPYGKGPLPSGEYLTGDLITPTGIDGMRLDTSDFAIKLEPQFNLNGRGGFYIHPDGGVPGTLGCIGLNCSAPRINEFLNLYSKFTKNFKYLKVLVK